MEGNKSRKPIMLVFVTHFVANKQKYQLPEQQPATAANSIALKTNQVLSVLFSFAARFIAFLHVRGPT